MMCGEKRSAHFSTDVGVPSLPRSLTMESLGTSWIDVKWQRPETPNGPVSGYNITWSDGDHGITSITNETTFNATHLKSGSPYKISVYAFNDGRQQRKLGPESVINVSTDPQQIPSKETPTSTIAIAATALFMVLLVGSAYVTVETIRRRKLARLVEEFDCHPLVSGEIAPPPRKHILNCWSSSV
ncbi:protein sidekick-2-like [Rhipicephalus sanguineus]|uniref:protein sidekick-2-like n=1 Tax=Rhipicephalus sanguineus TaxID=34632 RepID=UPI0020C3B274|nr:protein sidekick-2-like [Rhipicephalus sanguineus]